MASFADATDSNMEIDEIHAIVYGGREFHRRNAIAAPLYIVFGVGGRTYKTAAHSHRSPDWNESATFQIVSPLVPFRFQVFEERPGDQPDELVGIAILPLDKLPDKEQSRESVIKLKHPYEQKSRAYLLYECYVVKRKPKDSRPVIGWLNRTVPTILDSIVHTEIRQTVKSALMMSCQRSKDSSEVAASAEPSPFLIRKLMESHASMPIFPLMTHTAVVRIQSSTAETTADAQTQTDNVYPPPPVILASDPVSPLERSTELAEKELILESRQEFNKKSMFEYASSKFPLINDIQPEEGPVFGGTRIMITGRNFGSCAADIISLSVCGSDCLSSLEYENDCLLFCTTKAWRACIGAVVLVTHSGGRSRSEDTARFSFLAHSEPSDNFPDIVPTVALNDTPNLDDEIVVPDKWTAFLRSVDEGTQTATTINDNEIKQLARLLEDNNALKLALEETKRELEDLRRRLDVEKKKSAVTSK
uniref:C2 domain-containing protein n=1 Tax=Plectus sambesii TaxID=2011161 RepID=A0A914VPX0_9BILA